MGGVADKQVDVKRDIELGAFVVIRTLQIRTVDGANKYCVAEGVLICIKSDIGK